MGFVFGGFVVFVLRSLAACSTKNPVRSYGVSNRSCFLMEGEGEMLGLYWGLFFGGELLGNVLTFWFGCNFFVVEGETVFFLPKEIQNG